MLAEGDHMGIEVWSSLRYSNRHSAEIQAQVIRIKNGDVEQRRLAFSELQHS
jgi:hypothetical protein